MKWWTDCCDQLFPGFKTLRLWVAQQCRSSTPPPTSRRGRHISASFLDSRRGRNKWTLRGGKSADQNRPPIEANLQIGTSLLCLKTASDKGAAILVFHDLYCNQPPGGDQPHRRPTTHGRQSSCSWLRRKLYAHSWAVRLASLTILDS